MQIKALTGILLAAACTVFSSDLIAQDAPAKEAGCRACHGKDGAAPILPQYPKLNGQNKEYLISALKAYKADQRKGGLAAVMSGQAKLLSDKDMEEIAAFYASK